MGVLCVRRPGAKHRRVAVWSCGFLINSKPAADKKHEKEAKNTGFLANSCGDKNCPENLLFFMFFSMPSHVFKEQCNGKRQAGKVHCSLPSSQKRSVTCKHIHLAYAMMVETNCLIRASILQLRFKHMARPQLRTT